MPDTSSLVSPQPAMPRGVHTLTVNQVEAMLITAGVRRSRRHVLRMCQSGMLQATKIPGPSGDEWYVDPASVTKAIGDLRQLDEQRARRAALEPGTAGDVIPTKANTTVGDTVRHASPQPAPAAAVQDEKSTPTPRDAARHSPTDLDVYVHPYVKRLEQDNERLQTRLDDQVRRTEEIQNNHRKELIELHRMTAVGQSETLANFMLKAKDWIIGAAADQGREDKPPIAS